MAWQNSPNLQVWLVADDLASLGNGTSITVPWPDHGPNGTPATANGGLTLNTNDINGHSSISFNGTSGFFSIADRAGLRFTARFYGAFVMNTSNISSAAETMFCKGNTAG